MSAPTQRTDERKETSGVPDLTSVTSRPRQVASKLALSNAIIVKRRVIIWSGEVDSVWAEGLGDGEFSPLMLTHLMQLPDGATLTDFVLIT